MRDTPVTDFSELLDKQVEMDRIEREMRNAYLSDTLN